MGTRVPPRAQWRTPDYLPTPKRQACLILPIVPAVNHTLTILSNQLFEVWTHHVFKPGATRGRTTACTGEQGQCHIDHTKTSLRYMAWLCVKRYKVDEQRLIWLTPHAIAVEPRLREAHLDLRGLELEVGRVGPRLNGPVWARLNPDHYACTLIGGVEIAPQLERMWNAPPRQLDYKMSLRDIYDKMGIKPEEVQP